MRIDAFWHKTIVFNVQIGPACSISCLICTLVYVFQSHRSGWKLRGKSSTLPLALPRVNDRIADVQLIGYQVFYAQP